jgi:hypothetical protein
MPAGFLVAALFAAPAFAIDHPHDALKLILKQNTATGKAKAVWVSKNPPPVLPGSPPTSVGGAFIVTGADESASAPLPAGNWQTNPGGTLYKFLNKLAPNAPSAVKVAVLKGSTVLKVVAKDSVIQLNDTAQGTVSVALTIGSDTYCSVCTTALKDEPGKFIAKGCGAPTDCSAAVPTTSTTTTTTLPTPSATMVFSSGGPPQTCFPITVLDVLATTTYSGLSPSTPYSHQLTFFGPAYVFPQPTQSFVSSSVGTASITDVLGVGGVIVQGGTGQWSAEAYLGDLYTYGSFCLY